MSERKLRNVVIYEVVLFAEKYDYVGRLLKPGDQPQDYSDTEDEPGTPDKSKDD